MIRFFRHISIFFLLVTGIPLVYQPIHITNHAHNNSNRTHSHECSLPQLSNSEDQCYTCDFEFAAFKESESVKFSSDVLIFETLKYCLSETEFSESDYSIPSLRAPPVNS